MTVDRVKILVLGDSGVGKTSLVHLVSRGEPLSQISYTVGAAVEVKLHEYREGTPHQKPFWIGDIFRAFFPARNDENLEFSSREGPKISGKILNLGILDCRVGRVVGCRGQPLPPELQARLLQQLSRHHLGPRPGQPEIAAKLGEMAHGGDGEVYEKFCGKNGL